MSPTRTLCAPCPSSERWARMPNCFCTLGLSVMLDLLQLQVGTSMPGLA